MLHPYKLYIAVFDLAATEPYIHHGKQSTANDKGYITAMQEFFKIGYQERTFNGKVNNQVEIDPWLAGSATYQEVGK